MFIEFILVSLFAQSPNNVAVIHINRFTTVTACEASAQALRQGNAENLQKRVFACVPYDRAKQ